VWWCRSNWNTNSGSSLSSGMSYPIGIVSGSQNSRSAVHYYTTLFLSVIDFQFFSVAPGFCTDYHLRSEGVGLRSIGQSRENRREMLISKVIEQRIHCAITKITNTHSGTTSSSSSSRGLDSITTLPQWQSSCCNLSGLAWPLLTQCPPPSLACHGGGSNGVEPRW